MAVLGKKLGFSLATKTAKSLAEDSFVQGGSAWSAGNRLSTANGSGVRGSAVTGVWVAIAYYLNAVPATNQNPLSCLDGTGKGYDCNNPANNGTYGFRFGNGAGNAFVNTPTYTLTASDVAKVGMMVALSDVANSIVRLYVNRAQVGSGTAVTGYTPAQATIPCALGHRAGFDLNHASSWTLLGWCGGSAIPSEAEILALFDSVKTAGDIQEIPGKTTGLYSVKREVVGASFPSTLTDRAGSSGSMTFVAGSAAAITLSKVTSPTWAW